MQNVFSNEHEMERVKFALWCGQEPIHDEKGQLIGWTMPPEAEFFLRSIWADGESPLERWKRLGMP